MKAIGLVLFGALALGCAHTETNTSSNDKPVVMPKTHPGYVYLNKEDRAPAEAPELKWRNAVARLDVNSDAARGTKQVQINQEMIWTEIEPVMTTEMKYRDVEVIGTCSDFVCTGGTGKSPAWDKYFAAPKEKKAAALNDAILGVGVESSQSLIANRYFQTKPSTWSEFAATMNKAAAAGVIQKSIATKVLSTYGYDNMANLGYSKGACYEVVRQCSTTISRLEPVQVRTMRPIEKRKIVQTKNFDVNIEVLGALLLPTEKDTVALEVNENGAVSLQDNNGFNRYSIVTAEVQGGIINVQVKADSRILRPLSDNVVRQHSYTLVGDKPTFVLDVDPQYIPGQEDPNAQLVVDYTVHICEYGWTGTCSLGFGSWKTLKMESAPITAARTAIEVTDIPKKNRTELVFTISRKNSRFFNDKATSQRATDTIKLPK